MQKRSAPQRSVAYRFPMLFLGMLSLVVGTAAGLFRLGWAVSLPRADLAAWHGPLMLCGFFGAVIGLERAVALARPWAYVAPVCAGLGGLVLLLGQPAMLAGGLFSAAGSVLLAGSAWIYYRQRELYTLTLALGAASWLLGNLLWWLGWPMASVIGWWMGFLVLTIAGERLELSRFLPPSPVAARIFGVLVGVLLLSAVMATVNPAAGQRAFGTTLVMLAVWLLRQDVARRTVKQHGLTRFIAICLLSGYVWLAVGGVVMAGLLPATPFANDAALHAIFIGFVFSMVFGHAPVIFPAVARVQVPYHPVFYGPLLLLHGSLLARVLGDLAQWPALRSAGGALNALALAFFVAVTISAVVRGKRLQP
jgi:hypothetical protein